MVKNSTSCLLHQSVQLVLLGTHLEQSQRGGWAPVTAAVPGTRLSIKA